jgi:ABC-type cobalamin/Fe3+-siderophores transport system ATPase subunit
MYKVREVQISNFWNRLNAKCVFNDDVNIIIGRNGTGKTTFMNILHAALAVDVDEMTSSDFQEITIRLGHEKKTKTIHVKKILNELSPFQIVEYQVSRKKYTIRAIPSDDRRISPIYRRRAIEESAELRAELGRIVSLSSLSVYRLRNGEDFEIKDRSGKRLMSPVDFRLNQLKGDLTQYQFELSQSARLISSNLQKEVLASILFSSDSNPKFKVPHSFDREKEQQKLISAYARLNANDTSTRKKISFHINSVDDAVKNIKAGGNFDDLNFAAIEAFLRTQRIIDFSLKAEEEINTIYSQINLFVDILKEFIPDKNFSLMSGELQVSGLDNREIPVDKLSSGEKQLLILLVETLLQKSRPYVYLTDEPELSLHIEWQRKILPAVKRLNPHAQIIAATHSPEVASKYKGLIIDMKSVINE